MPIRAVVYTSEAAVDIAASRLGQTGGRLCEIVDDAARFNRDAGVTGVLLFGWRALSAIHGRPGRWPAGGIFPGTGCQQPQWPDRTAAGQGGAETTAFLAHALAAGRTDRVEAGGQCGLDRFRPARGRRCVHQCHRHGVAERPGSTPCRSVVITFPPNSSHCAGHILILAGTLGAGKTMAARSIGLSTSPSTELP